MIDCQTERPPETAQTVSIRTHTLVADIGPTDGGRDAGPGPHDLFDAALASCKALTATYYARQHNIPLESVETHVERDNSNERQGAYRLRVRVAFHGPLDDAQRHRLYEVVGKCPIHKLMTTATIEIVTEPLAV